MRNKILSNANVAYFSLLLSFGAVLFSGIQAFESHSQLLFTVKPSITFVTEDDPDDPLVSTIGIEINNSGPAPALIKSIIYYVDGKAVGNPRSVIKAGKLNPDKTTYVEFEEGDSLAVGESNWLLRHYKKGRENHKELRDFITFIDDHLSIEVNFCSLTGTCWTKCSTRGGCNKSAEVG
ncbi:MAG: hypothetical protein HY052_05675 [Proteobacteria bacterium]|nr:hypothetical protein [Pseudomonadota bacterium]